MTTTELQHATWAYDWCVHTTGLQLPYHYGGGHGVEPVKPWGIPPSGGGYDCSGAASGALWYAGVLDQQEALDTEQFESWGAQGAGEYLTLRVLNVPGVIQHCFLVFTGLGAARPDRMFAAQIPGTLVGWFEASGEWVNSFHARHAA